MNLYCVISHIYAICSKSGKSWTFYIHTLTSRVCAWKERKFSAVCVTSLSLSTVTYQIDLPISHGTGIVSIWEIFSVCKEELWSPRVKKLQSDKTFFELHVQVFCNFFGGWGLGKNGGTWQCAGVLAVHYCTSSACDRKSCDRKLLLNGFHSHLSKFAPQHRDLL